MTTGFSGFKKRMAILSVLCMIITMMPVSTFASEASDIPSHWAKGQIQSWMDNGLIKGYSDGTFRPDNKITRAEFMALVNGAFNYTEKASINYADVSTKAWYADAIAKAKAAGYISGYADNTMKPNSPITRAEAASIISKIDYLQISGTEIAEFTDATALTWSKGAVIGAAAADIMTGYSDGSFKPQNNIKRGEAVVALDRALSYSKNNTVYSSAGTYGPESGNLAVAGNVTVIEKGTTLKNMTIAGDLIISKNVEDGNITLNNVTVKGQTYIYGGGQNSIIVIDSTLGKVTVSKENGKIRIVVSGNTTVGQVLANSGVKLEEGTLTGNASGFQEITLDASDNDSIILIGSFSEVNVDVEGMNIEIPEGSTIGNLVLDKQAAVTGTGTVTTATINASGVTFEKAPKASNVASGVTAPTVGTGTTPTTTTGGGTSSHTGNSTIAVTAISVIGASNSAIVVNGGTLQMSATVSPATATNQTIVWSVTSGTGIATISSTGLLTGTGVGTVTVKATNAASGVYGTKEIVVVDPLISGVAVANREDSLEAGQPIQENDGKFDATIASDAANEFDITFTVSDVLETVTGGAPVAGEWMGISLQLEGITDIETMEYSANGTDWTALEEDEAILAANRANSFMYYVNAEAAPTTRYLRDANGTVYTLVFDVEYEGLITAVTVANREDSLEAGQPIQENDGKFDATIASDAANEFDITFTVSDVLETVTGGAPTAGEWMGISLQLEGITDIATMEYSANGTDWTALEEDEAILAANRANSFMYYVNAEVAPTTRYLRDANGTVYTLVFDVVDIV